MPASHARGASAVSKMHDIIRFSGRRQERANELPCALGITLNYKCGLPTAEQTGHIA
jgi:hypothetical protein